MKKMNRRTGISVSAAAHVLFRSALYLFSSGDVISEAVAAGGVVW